MKTVTLIPMRKGSRRIPGKHLRMLDGLTPAMRAVNAALGLKSPVFVSTNDTDIALHLKRKAVTILDQPSASDTSRTEECIKHFIEQIECDRILLIQATNPFQKTSHLAKALSLIDEMKADSLLSGVWLHRYVYRPIDELIIKPIDQRCARRTGVLNQNPRFIENGAFYIFSAKDFERTGKILNGKIAGYPMSFESLIELDEQSDWELAESIISNRIR